MDLLLLLQAYGTCPLPDSAASALDLNADGLVSMFDLLEMLSRQPPIPKE